MQPLATNRVRLRGDDQPPLQVDKSNLNYLAFN